MNNTNTERALELISLPEVEAMTHLKKSSIYGRMNIRSRTYDRFFPHPISLSSSASGRGRVAWIAEEVQAWLEMRVKASRQQIRNW